MAVLGQIAGSHHLLVHKLSEGNVTGLLEPDVVIEGVLDELVDLAFELEQLERESVWVLEVLFVFDNRLSLRFDERLHDLD